MSVATSGVHLEVGIRELKNNLSRYLDQVRRGDVVTVTDRGDPIARLTAVDASTDKLAELITLGLVQQPVDRQRSRPARRIKSTGSVSELVAEQRR